MTSTPPPSQPGVLRWSYLIYFGFAFVGLLFTPDVTAARWVQELVLVGVAVSIYVVAELRRWCVPGAVALILFGFGATALGSSLMTVIPIYSAALAASTGTWRQVARRLAAITMVVPVVPLVVDIPWPYGLFYLVPAIMVWVIGFSVHRDAVVGAHVESLTADNARIAHLARSAERERIARDLHDLAGQALTAIVLRSQMIQRSDDPADAVVEAKAIETLARDTLSSIRQTVAGWQSVSLAEELATARAALDAAGVEVVVDGDWGLDVAPPVETVLALALREAVTNIVRHARASRTTMSLEQVGQGVSLRVTDDGVGLPADSLGMGTGLRGMRERVFAAGGSVEIAGRRGTTLEVVMPFGGVPS